MVFLPRRPRPHSLTQSSLKTRWIKHWCLQLMVTHTPPPLLCQYNHGVSLQRLLGSGAVSPGGGCGQPGDQGKKMMHHCHVCNRGFLNKSNIKVNREPNIYKLIKVCTVSNECSLFRFTWGHTQARSHLVVITAAKPSDRKPTSWSTCLYTRESPETRPAEDHNTALVFIFTVV